MPDAIDPDKIPGKLIDPDEVEAQAAAISGIASSVEDNGFQVQSQWQAMAGVYSAPESGTLLGLMQPVNASATAVAGNLSTVAGALSRFAAEVRPIKQELDALRVQAQTFVDTTVAHGVDRRELNPAWTARQTTYGAVAATPYSSPSTGGTTTAQAAEPAQYRTVHKEWHEDQDAIDRNNDLVAQVSAQQVKLWEAERTCANTIRALFGGGALHAATSAEEDPLAYGIDEIPAGTEMPWGADVERTEGCGEASVRFVFEDFLWNGIIVGGVWGTVTGLGTLVLGYNPETGDFFSREAYGAAWGNLGKLAFSLAANTGVLAPIFQADSAANAMGMGGFLPQELRDFKQDADEAALNTGKALIAWDTWAEDPGAAAGEVVFNLGTILIPAGAAVSGVKAAGTASSVVSKMARVVDLVDPGALVFNGAMKAGGFAIKGFDDLIGRLGDSAKLGDEVSGAVEVFHGADVASSVSRLVDDLGIPAEQVFVGHLADGTPVLRGPGVEVRLEPGAFDEFLDASKAVGGADAVVAPVRERELVMAGGGSDAGRVTNSIVEDAPVRTDTHTGDTHTGAGSGEHQTVREPDAATGGGGHGGHSGSAGGGHGNGAVSDGGRGGGVDGDRDITANADGSEPEGLAQPSVPRETPVSDSIAAGTDPMSSGVPGVDGEWHRGVDGPATLEDLQYGEPMSQHGEATYPEDPVNGRSGFDLIEDPSAPYGRGADGSPFTSEDYDSRYVFSGNNWDNYPPNDGAVRGSRIVYENLGAFIRDYGDQLDRIGPPRGDYLALKPDGLSASFEQRSLPVRSLANDVYDYEFTGYLPSGWTVEISKIAPAFGRPGGGFQILVHNEVGDVIRVADLEEMGVLR